MLQDSSIYPGATALLIVLCYLPECERNSQGGERGGTEVIPSDMVDPRPLSVMENPLSESRSPGGEWRCITKERTHIVMEIKHKTQPFTY